MNQKTKKIRWVARILSLVLLIIILPFYFSYGNPLPFFNPEYTFYDNLWLSIFPLVLIGLGLGWKYERIAGFLIVIPILLGIVVSIFIGAPFGLHITLPFIAGFLYLVASYRE
ncbi:MAG: hypothetical protein WC146_02700 [Patescibacteria group bacterium]|jgi:uncharacterized membrane protein AbrB (regulator of aidB expression)